MVRFLQQTLREIQRQVTRAIGKAAGRELDKRFRRFLDNDSDEAPPELSRKCRTDDKVIRDLQDRWAKRWEK
jgi:hypothetical protein